MKRLAILLTVLASCSPDGSDEKSGGAPAAADGADEFTSLPGTMISSGSYEKRNEENAAKGAAHVTGSVLNADGTAFAGSFEIVLSPSGSGPGVAGTSVAQQPEPIRIFYGDGGQFKLWPMPGSWKIRAHAKGGQWSNVASVTIVPGTNVTGVQLTMP